MSWYDSELAKIESDYHRGLLTTLEYEIAVHNLQEMIKEIQKDNLKDDEEGEMFR